MSAAPYDPEAEARRLHDSGCTSGADDHMGIYAQDMTCCRPCLAAALRRAHEAGREAGARDMRERAARACGNVLDGTVGDWVRALPLVAPPQEEPPVAPGGEGEGER